MKWLGPVLYWLIYTPSVMYALQCLSDISTNEDWYTLLEVYGIGTLCVVLGLFGVYWVVETAFGKGEKDE